MPTREFLHGHWLTVSANWAKFADWSECFQARMEVLERLSRAYPHYAAALKAANGEQYVTAVSLSWSTDPERAGKVLAVYDAHADVFSDHAASGIGTERCCSDRAIPGLKVETWGTLLDDRRSSDPIGTPPRCIQHSVFLFQRK